MKFKYPIVLIGKTGSGKTTVAKELEKLGVKRLISYTTRPMREGEKEGIDYHFVDETTFFNMVYAGKIAEITSRSIDSKDFFYGTSIENYGVNYPSVSIMDLNGIRTLKVMGIPHTCILLNISNSVAMQRCLNRKDTPDEIEKRLKLERMTFSSASTLANIVIDANDTLFNVVQAITDKLGDDLSYWKRIAYIQSMDHNFYILYGIDNSELLTKDNIVAYVHAYTGEVIYVHPHASNDPRVRRIIEKIQNEISFCHPFSYDWMESFILRHFQDYSLESLKAIGLNINQILKIQKTSTNT